MTGLQDLPWKRVGIYQDINFSTDSVAGFRDQLASWLKTQSQSNLQQFILLTSEWLTNLIKHADKVADFVSIELMECEHSWRLLIVDNGSCASQFETLIREADAEFGEFKESGMGLALIKALADTVNYYCADGFNNLELQLNKVKSAGLRHVLLVDDDKSILTLLEAYLETDYRVTVFSSALAAIEWLDRNSPDLVISDLNMPELDGVDFRIKVQEADRSLPFVFLTGEDAGELYRLAIDDVLHKPVSRQQLLDTVERVLTRHQQLQRDIGSSLAPMISSQLKPEIRIQPAGMTAYSAWRTVDGGGGDFIFQYARNDGHVVMLADVMGHDRQAKFFAHAYQGFLTGLAAGLVQSGQALDAGRFLTSFSQVMEDVALLGSSLLTAVVVQSAGTGELCIASAGHPKPWVLENGDFSDIDLDAGPLLGFVGCRYPSSVICFDSPLVFFTDGLIEAMSAQDLSELKKRLAQQLMLDQPNLEAVMNYYDSKVGNAPPDDVTLLVLIPDGWAT